jgi:hypothetical protein
MVPSMKKETDIRYPKIWKRKKQEEKKVNREQVPEITRFAVVQEKK